MKMAWHQTIRIKIQYLAQVLFKIREEEPVVFILPEHFVTSVCPIIYMKEFPFNKWS
jgi:hypothetical protein